ncbi:MAG TPA: MTH1187 family thiamine-binding protein [Thermodesulfobacteriota bacterium]|nr:MTH1187 family thiamine-binding protein [Thermodesulfobacteriota bacterium]
MALAEISVIPIGTPTSSIGDWIAESIRTLQNEKIKYEVSPMGTLIEGKASDIFRIAGKMHETALKKGIKRVITTLTVDAAVIKRLR